MHFATRVRTWRVARLRTVYSELRLSTVPTKLLKMISQKGTRREALDSATLWKNMTVVTGAAQSVERLTYGLDDRKLVKSR
jgi:hypothetical protein